MAEYKFKKGQHVRALETGEGDIQAGTIYEITKDGDHAHFLDDVGTDRRRPADAYELVEDTRKRTFKVGDRVRIVKRRPGNNTGSVPGYQLPDGNVGAVGILQDDYIAFSGAQKLYRVGDDAYLGFFTDEELELIEDATFKVGDTVMAISQSYSWGEVSKGDIGKVVETKDDRCYVDFPAQQHWTASYSDLRAAPESTTEGVYTGIPDKAVPWTKEETKQPIKKEKKPMATKYYRVKQDLPDLNTGAILKKECDGYVPITDLWNTDALEKASENGDSPVWEPTIVEQAKDWFERVYEVGVLGKTKYLAKSAAQDAYASLHKVGKDKA